MNSTCLDQEKYLSFETVREKASDSSNEESMDDED
jgi:hypothetical protein